MPAIYAHDRFGTSLISTLPPSIRDKLLAYPSALRLGFQGPDVLFYHKPLKSNPVKQKGVDMHHSLADAFFIEQAKNLINEGEELTPSPYLSYVGGFLCHYLLDYHLHPYIYEIENTGISHGKIESEFDKYLLKKDNLPWRGMNTADVYMQGAGTKRAVSKALNVTEEEAALAIKTMRDINKLFSHKCQLVHAVCHGGLKIVKMDNKFGDMFRRKKDEPACEEVNEKLFNLMKECSLRCMDKVKMYFINLKEIATTQTMDELFHENYTGGVF